MMALRSTGVQYEAVQFVLALAEMHGATKKLERLL